MRWSILPIVRTSRSNNRRDPDITKKELTDGNLTAPVWDGDFYVVVGCACVDFKAQNEPISGFTVSVFV